MTLLSSRRIFKPLNFILAIGLSSHAFAGISQSPLFLSSSAKPNMLVILDNSNSMDENASGAAAGSNSPSSKSEIARSVIKNLISTYTDQINMGLMSYKQSSILNRELHNSPYDVSYNPANYYPTFTGARESTSKRFRIPNPVSPGDFIHYNVALAFYSTLNEGNGFCYSPTAHAFNNNENPISGPWDNYRCFNKKTGSSDTVPTWKNTTSEANAKYSGYMGQLTFSPTDSDLAQGIVDFGIFNTYHYVSTAYLSTSSPGRGFLNTPIRPLDATQSSALKTVLACNIPGTPANASPAKPIPAPCTASGIKNAGLTPIEGTLLTAKDYFAGSLTDTTEGYASSGTNKTYPLPISCGKNFVILISDGLPSTDKNGAIITNPTAAIAAAAKATQDLKTTNIETYVVGFALPYGTNPDTLNTIATSGGTKNAYLANDYETLSAALNNIFKDILNKSNSAASIASNSTRLDVGSRIYQAKFDATNWSGELLANSIDEKTGALTEAWNPSAAAQLINRTDRNIYTYSPTNNTGIAFNWSTLDAAQKTSLNTLANVNDGKGALRVNWLRGDDTHEQKKSGGLFRNRISALGDIVNSDPIYAGQDDYGYATLPGSEGDNYKTFRISSAYTGRNPMLYVGANDGMLHGFNVKDGSEAFAYMPNALFPKLSALTSPNYTHQYYVDGASGLGDVYDGTKWRTLLAGTTGAGGRAVFALDVTDPSAFNSSSVMWEFTDINDADLGYTLAQPSVVRMQNGQWTVIIGNGYNSSNGHAVLFILDALTGNLLKKIDTNIGNQNGLSSPIGVDTNNDHSVDTIYAGDLAGNLWKFDVSGSVSDWDVAYKVDNIKKPLFVACTIAGITCDVANRQPITAKPNVGWVGDSQNQSGLMVYFGTGKYFETGDNIVNASPQVQTFYGLWDNSTPIIDRNKLQEQAITFEGMATTFGGTSTTKPVRVVSKEPVCYAANSTGCTESSLLKNGWALNLRNPNKSAEGERATSFPLVRRGLVVFSTTTPNAEPCSFGGTSRLMEIDALSGGEFSGAPFDINGDGKVNNNDKIKVTVNGVESFVFASGIDVGVGIIKTPAVIESDTAHIDYKYVSGSTGKMGTVIDAGSGAQGTHSDPNAFKSWRQLN